MEEIPGFFTAAMLKKFVPIWFLPLLFFLLAMYVTAFTEGMMVFIIFSMTLMMHPVMSIPMSVSLKCLKFFTMSFYFAMITLVQFYLTYRWENFREIKSNDKNTGKGNDKDKGNYKGTF